MNIGEVSKPFIMMNKATNKEVVAVIKVKSKVDTHKANLTEDYQMIKSIYDIKNKQTFLNNWIAKKQKETYISIDPEWIKCQFQYPGWIKK
jgi:peptidyl-prolyl cis-trans isomerase SurA